MKQILRGMKRALIVSAIVSATLIGGKNYSTVSVVAAADSVVFSMAEADSLIDLIDDQVLEIRLLEIDLSESRKIARVDSIMHERIIEVYKGERGSFLGRALRKPELWFMIGVTIGAQAVR